MSTVRTHIVRVNRMTCTHRSRTMPPLRQCDAGWVVASVRRYKRQRCRLHRRPLGHGDVPRVRGAMEVRAPATCMFVQCLGVARRGGARVRLPHDHWQLSPRAQLVQETHGCLPFALWAQAIDRRLLEAAVECHAAANKSNDGSPSTRRKEASKFEAVMDRVCVVWCVCCSPFVVAGTHTTARCTYGRTYVCMYASILCTCSGQMAIYCNFAHMHGNCHVGTAPRYVPGTGVEL